MKNRLKTVLLLGALSGMLVALGAALGGGFLHASLAMAALMNLGAWFFSDRIVLAMSRAREVAPDEAPGLHRIVSELAQAAGIPKPRVYWTPDLQPNAFATGRSPEKAVVAVTAGIVNPLAGRGGMLSLFSTHPPMEERVRRLRAMALGQAHG